MKIGDIVKVTKGRLLSGSPELEIDLASISTDSRTINPGQFFLPIKGVNFNGEKFIGCALKNGALGTFTTQRVLRSIQQDKAVIQVKDAIDALQRLAHHNRMRFDVPVIGVTGSNGKTTVKDMVAKVLSSKFNVLKSEGTKNNHIGVPLTLLKLNSSHNACVVEMGTNHYGEIRLLAGLALPTIAIITNIGPSHLEFLKDLKGVFAAKKEILGVLNRDSIAIINGDDEYLSKINSKVFKIIKFGFNAANDLRLSEVSSDISGMKFTLNGKSPFALNMIGTHNVHNALAAIAVAYNFGISYLDVKKALSEFLPAGMRLNTNRVGGITVINDAYNSNPLSMSSAIKALAEYPAKGKWIVSADMLELGQKEEDFHKTIGEAIAKFDFSGLITFGSLSRHTSSRALECGMNKKKVWHCSDRANIAEILKRSMGKGDVVLVKGSRAMKMEDVIKNLEGR